MAGEKDVVASLRVPAKDSKKEQKKQKRGGAAGDEMTDDDKRVKADIELLVERTGDADLGVVALALETLSRELKAATSSMTSVPKPLKFLRPHLDRLVDRYKELEADTNLKRDFAMVLSVTCTTSGDARRLSLHFCLEAKCKDVTSWGYEFLRNLSGQIAAAFADLQQEPTPGRKPNTDVEKQKKREKGCTSAPEDAENAAAVSAVPLTRGGSHAEADVIVATGLAGIEVSLPSGEALLQLVEQIVPYYMQHNAEVDAVDLLTEVERPQALLPLLDANNYQRVVAYLLSLSNYAASSEESLKAQTVAFDALMQQQQYFDALRVGLRLGDRTLVDQVLRACKDPLMLQQLALLLCRQRVDVEFDDEKLQRLVSGSKTSPLFRMLAKELDVLEPKVPEDVFKRHLEEPQGRRARLAGLESAQQNLASSFVNAFVNCGFGTDKLMTAEGSGWLYKNKDRGMVSTAASLGALCLWNVDEALQHIDKHQYSSDPNVKAGALLGFGVASCNVRHECDAALALLKDHLETTETTPDSPLLKAAAAIGLGCAYAGSCRDDILDLLVLVILDGSLPLESAAFASLSLGLCFVGSASADAAEAILTALMDRCSAAKGVDSPMGHFLSVGLGLVFLGTRDSAEGVLCAVAALPHAAFSALATKTIEGLAAAGSGDVLKVQRMLGVCAESRPDGFWRQKQEELQKDQQQPPDPAAAAAIATEVSDAGASSSASVDGAGGGETTIAGGGGTGAAGGNVAAAAGDTSVSAGTTTSAPSATVLPALATFSSLTQSASAGMSSGGSNAAQTGDAEEAEEHADDGDQAVAVLNIALLAFAEETGADMALRLYDHILQYADVHMRRAVPLAVSLQHPSNPKPSLIDLLSKLSHDADADTALNAIFAMGVLGAGTNHSRLASLLRQLASYYGKDPNALFVVRLAQGLLYLGKGLLQLGALHSDRQVVCRVSLGAMAIIAHSALLMRHTFLGRFHFILYYLFPAVQPRWLITVAERADSPEPLGSSGALQTAAAQDTGSQQRPGEVAPPGPAAAGGGIAMETDGSSSSSGAQDDADEDLRMLPVPVRVGEAVDIVAQVGRQPKTITGFQTHTSPVLLNFSERAEIATDEYLPVARVLEGVVLLRKNPEYKPPKAP